MSRKVQKMDLTYECFACVLEGLYPAEPGQLSKIGFMFGIMVGRGMKWEDFGFWFRMTAASTAKERSFAYKFITSLDTAMDVLAVALQDRTIRPQDIVGWGFEKGLLRDGDFDLVEG